VGEGEWQQHDRHAVVIGGQRLDFILAARPLLTPAIARPMSLTARTPLSSRSVTPSTAFSRLSSIVSSSSSYPSDSVFVAALSCNSLMMSADFGVKLHSTQRR
jgi:hypothetical protein